MRLRVEEAQLRLSRSLFFSCLDLPSDLTEVGNESFLGQVTLINYRKPGAVEFDCSYVMEAVFKSPSLDGNGRRLLNNYVYSENTFEREVEGHLLSVKGIFYCQQNSKTHVCAHACLRMAVNTIGNPEQFLTSAGINKFLNVSPPLSGLSVEQVHDVINASGAAKSVIINCSGLENAVYLSSLASILESGYMCLLVFTTAGAEEHVVTVYGHTRNSDQWHPEAIPAYGGPSSAPFYSSSAWISNYLIHDDNFGPYFTLSSRALDSNPDVKAHWIIAVMPHSPATAPHVAEAIATAALSNNLVNFAPLGKGQWFSYITRQHQNFVLRTVLLTREEYMEHLKASVGHDASKVTDQQLALYSPLPPLIWVVEYTLPYLYTGNRSKLGEVVVDASKLATVNDNVGDFVAAIRLPGHALIKDTLGNFAFHPMDLDSHSPVFRRADNEHEW
ncbi:hypothetical protein [Roseomonas sp. BN140053]|uniref:hypothetical protein n=1 Tax=Roseomonas sp. BN140053 TaxID=3391898 RepID=UPI0039E906A4